MKETLLDRQAALAVPPRLTRMDASELLALVNPPDDVDVVAQMPGSAEPIVWTAPRGNGRLLFSGAMDAWRFRSADFDRFWQSAIAGLGLSARQAMSIEVSAGRASVQVRDEDAAVSGALLIAQNDGSVATQPIRLMPDAARGQFSGLLGVARVSPADRLVVTAERAGSKIEQITLAEPLVIGVPLEASGPPLGLLSATHRGVDVTPDHLDVLERFLRSTAAGSPSPIVRRPMRSAWWMFPFAGCLSAEWWLRRKRGAR